MALDIMAAFTNEPPVRARLADNLALGKNNPTPKIAEAVEPKPRNHEDDLER